MYGASKEKLKQRACSVRCLVYHHHGGIVSMEPRVSVTLAFREKVVRSGRNKLGYQEGVSYSAEKAQYRSSNKEGTLS